LTTADSTEFDATPLTPRQRGVVADAAQTENPLHGRIRKALMWDRWQKGRGLLSIKSLKLFLTGPTIRRYRESWAGKGWHPPSTSRTGRFPDWPSDAGPRRRRDSRGSRGCRPVGPGPVAVSLRSSTIRPSAARSRRNGRNAAGYRGPARPNQAAWDRAPPFPRSCRLGWEIERWRASLRKSSSLEWSPEQIAGWAGKRNPIPTITKAARVVTRRRSTAGLFIQSRGWP